MNKYKNHPDRKKSIRDRKRFISCARKKKFQIREEAEEFAGKVRQKVYECPYCGCFHLTKSWRTD